MKETPNFIRSNRSKWKKQPFKQKFFFSLGRAREPKTNFYQFQILFFIPTPYANKAILRPFKKFTTPRQRTNIKTLKSN